MRNRSWLVALAVLALGGCGVPADRDPRPIEPSVTIGSYEGPMAAVSPGAFVQRIFLVRDNQLVAVDRRVEDARSPERLVEDLVSGPTPQERAAGLDSALAGTSYITGVRVRGGTAVVGLAADNPIRNDETLAYGQIVCTLTARADIVSVRFGQAGRPVEVPRGDGALTGEPVTEADYANLVAR